MTTKVTPGVQEFPITEWKAYTPTFTGFGTVTNVSCFSRRVGDSLEIQGSFTVGTPIAVEARISLGFDGVTLTSDPDKCPSGTSACGSGGRSPASNSAWSIHPLKEPGVEYLTLGLADASTSYLSKVNGSAAFGTGAKYSFTATVPIQGW